MASELTSTFPRGSFARLVASIWVSTALATLILAAAAPSLANAALISVDNATDIPHPFGCDLRQAIVSHNEKMTPFFSNCTPGDGNDIISIGVPHGIVDIGSPLPGINGTLKIVPAVPNACSEIRQAAYMTVNFGATLTLQGVGIVVNGAEPRSIIDNNGGTLNIVANGTCSATYSNVMGKERKPDVGGILFSRNNGITTIDGANFVRSSANRGGLIYIESGTVSIIDSANPQPSRFTDGIANQGGGIYVNSGAVLKIASNNFTFDSNRATAGNGGAIYSDFGTVSIKRGIQPVLANVAITLNTAGNGSGGAIYVSGGRLNIDGIEIRNNSASGRGGAIMASNLPLLTPAVIVRSFFHHNSSNTNGGAIYSARSAVDVSESTFAQDRAGQGGEGIYADAGSTLNVINSTFIGGTDPDGIIVLYGGTSNIVFSTFFFSDLGEGLPTGAPAPNLFVSNSILRAVTCESNSVKDETGNIQYQSGGCPAGIPRLNPQFDPALLADNGGPTPTIALQSTSPAIDRIIPADCVDQNNKPVAIDQRGFTRPFRTNCDTGAFEFGASGGSGVGGIPPGALGHGSGHRPHP